ncbi:MAG: L-histidine N(alpha)-methyltransferase [Deltaproteobacteria bacterium]|nr:L-histidine N(alpha)-methyltransferase [Deltaproteobacteria bacterium]
MRGTAAGGGRLVKTQCLRKQPRPAFDYWDLQPPPVASLGEVLAGLRLPRKRLASKYFYDERGSFLFEEICRLPEYYPTRTELGILRHRAAEIAGLLDTPCAIIEYGCGSAEKIAPLLAAAPQCRAYIGIDLSRAPLRALVASLAEDFPDVSCTGICADFLAPLDLSLPPPEKLRRVVFFPGSSIGNFEPEEALALLRRMARMAGPGGGLLVGVDLKKDKRTLEAAYNDSRGVTAAFNKNLLRRINYECDADFSEERFEHLAFYNVEKSRIEMHLVSPAPQTVHLGLAPIEFLAGETIHTENSHKYGPEEFSRLAEAAGWSPAYLWTDPDNLFSVQFFTATQEENHAGKIFG